MQLNKESINELLLEEIESEEHPSDFDTTSEYSVLILRLPSITNSELKIDSLAFVLKNGTVFRYNRDKQIFEELGDFTNLHSFLDNRIDKLIREIREYHIEIDRLEESLYESENDRNFNAKWMLYKKDISLINRLMFHAVVAFELFNAKYRKYKEYDKLLFDDLTEHMKRVRDLASAGMEKLDNIHDFYRASVDERMNRNMYWLTIISAIFLPLTLVTGFFGMNTGGLPYTNTPDGTMKVVILSLILEGLFLAMFIAFGRVKREKFSRKNR